MSWWKERLFPQGLGTQAIIALAICALVLWKIDGADVIERLALLVFGYYFGKAAGKNGSGAVNP